MDEGRLHCAKCIFLNKNLNFNSIVCILFIVHFMFDAILSLHFQFIWNLFAVQLLNFNCFWSKKGMKITWQIKVKQKKQGIEFLDSQTCLGMKQTTELDGRGKEQLQCA